MLKKKLTSLQTLVIRVCWTTMNMFPHWISKSCIRKHKNHSKTSNGAEKFAKNLRAGKNSQYNVQNCKSGRQNRRHIFRRLKPKYKSASTNIPSYCLKVNQTHVMIAYSWIKSIMINYVFSIEMI